LQYELQEESDTIRSNEIKNMYPIPQSLKRLATGFVLLIGLCISGDGTENDRKQAISFILRARALQPGEVIVIEARSLHPLQSLRVKAFDADFAAFSGKNSEFWTAVIGIDLETRPGRYAVELKGVDIEGKSATARRIVSVVGKQFPTRTLKVDEKYVAPPADALRRIEKEQERVGGIFASVTSEKLWQGPFRAPVPGKAISVFGKRNVYNGQARSPHTGVDFRGAAGTPIQAPNSGKVMLAADLYFSGNTVILDHGLGLYSYLAHMSEISVKEGDAIEGGGMIGKVGATGRVTGPHLHWTVRIGRARVDPLSLISALRAF
jgi:murein DD-endopeptidase MepM/ murein hydrolase activator NlpD